MALANGPAFHGQQRSLRRMRQVLSWALARSPGDRSWAWARLASFCKAGLVRPRQGVSTGSPAPWQPLPASTIRPAPASSRMMPQILAAVRSGTAPGSGPETRGSRRRGGDDLQVHAVAPVLAGVEGPVGGDPVDGD